MIGATSGRQSGTVQYTCMSVYGVFGNKELLCQGQATYLSAGGDSGAPVVAFLGGGNAAAVGIHWAHQVVSGVYQSWFSSMSGILDEFYYGVSGAPYLSPFIY